MTALRGGAPRRITGNAESCTTMMDAGRQRLLNEIRMRDEEIRRLKEEVGALKDRYQAAVILFKAPFALGVAMGAAAVGVIVLLIH